jgi:hypothetical protein
MCCACATSSLDATTDKARNYAELRFCTRLLRSGDGNFKFDHISSSMAPRAMKSSAMKKANATPICCVAFKNLNETVGKREQQFLHELTTLLQVALKLAHERDQYMPADFQRRARKIDNRLEDWLVDRFGRYELLSSELKRLAKHVANHRDEWLLFLRDPAVPPTNNHAEQMLRPAVITRKVGACNKNLWGSLVHSVLSSMMVTCHRRGKRFLDLARQLWQNNEPAAIPVDTLPDPSHVTPPAPPLALSQAG